MPQVVGKRFLLFVAVILLLVGYRLSDNGLLAYCGDGVYATFDRRDNMTVHRTPPLFCPRGGYERIDMPGEREDAAALLAAMKAAVVARETVGDIEILYAYTPRIHKSESLSIGRVNVMIALSNGGRVIIGSPLIKGSF
ncbi:MAG: hypothetical protein LBH24_02855 [Clostridiales bacterium]|jgi:hypothetical protein|nr:hypothetical protein [Clostridiales bacterium]